VSLGCGAGGGGTSEVEAQDLDLVITGATIIGSHVSVPVGQ